MEKMMEDMLDAMPAGDGRAVSRDDYPVGEVLRACCGVSRAGKLRYADGTESDFSFGAACTDADGRCS